MESSSFNIDGDDAVFYGIGGTRRGEDVHPGLRVGSGRSWWGSAQGSPNLLSNSRGVLKAIEHFVRSRLGKRRVGDGQPIAAIDATIHTEAQFIIGRIDPVDTHTAIALPALR